MNLKRFWAVFFATMLIVLTWGNFSSVSAQSNYTLPAPAGVSDGYEFVLFGQGWGRTFPVREGKVVIPGDIGAQSIWGNFRKDGSWLKIENLSSIPAGWRAMIKAGTCQGDRLTCDGVEEFVDKSTFALVAPIATNNAFSSFTVGWRQGYASLQLPSELNSISFSGAGRQRPSVSLPTGGPKGLVNVGQLLREATPVVVMEQGGRAVIVPARHQGGGLWTAPVPAGTVFQWAYQDPQGIIAWSTVGAARLTGGVTRLDGNAPPPVGPYAYRAQK